MCKYTFVFLLFLILTGHSHAYERVYEPVIPEKIVVSVGGKHFKKYQSLRLKALRAPSYNIQQKFKNKTFKVRIATKHSGDWTNVAQGRARLTGDWKDHLGQASDNVSSISVKLVKGNLGGVIRFRLLLPKTKRAENEIFWSSLMEELGFPVPFRKIVTVDFAGYELPMIFEEKPAKEFLESWGMREAPIIEADERQMWFNAEHWAQDSRGQWVEPLFPAGGHRQYKIDNKAFIKNAKSVEMALKAINAEKQNEVITVFDQVNKVLASHGLNRHNRKYIYEPFYNILVPIYFDGMVSFKHEKTNKFYTKKCASIENPLLVNVINKVKAKYLSRAVGYEFSPMMECVARVILDDQENYIPKIVKKEYVNPESPIKKDDLFLLDRSPDGPFVSSQPVDVIKINSYFDGAARCTYDQQTLDWTVCQNKDFGALRSYISGSDQPTSIGDYLLAPYLDVKYNGIDKSILQELSVNGQSIDLEVADNKTLALKLNAKNSDIIIRLATSSSKIVIYSSDIENSTITVKTLDGSTEINNEVRYDLQGLTACLTLLDTSIEALKIFSENCKLEDAVNLVRVSGDANKLSVINASHDGLDMDFSDVSIDSIHVQNSGNDCLDVSGGFYYFVKLRLQGCVDKGISAGEKSIVVVEKGEIKNVNLGVAAKDSSLLSADSIKLENFSECGSVFNKKQEFNGALLMSFDFECDPVVDVSSTRVNIKTVNCRSYYFTMLKYNSSIR